MNFKSSIPGGGSRTILLSKRANIFYLDRVRVYVRNETVLYQIASEQKLLDYNLPDCNTSLVLLGKGSSITDAAARALAKSGVMLGFAGSGGTPLHCVSDFVFLSPADEYRPTEYCHDFIKIWLDSDQKLKAAKQLQLYRLENTFAKWNGDYELSSHGSILEENDKEQLKCKIQSASNEQDLLLIEAAWTKKLYKNLVEQFNVSGFKRTQGENVNTLNNFMDHGNYLMYGLSAVALHALGIPFSFPLLHGKTRRGGLIFDIADLYKDAVVMPHAFKMSKKNSKDLEQQFRISLITKIHNDEILDNMINTIKKIIKEFK